MANEKRLIDANALAENVYALRFYVTGMRNGKTLLHECMEKYRNEVLRTICKAPTVDAVEVVRCKNCKHMEVTPDHLRWCNAWNGINGMGDEGFCNYGERKDSNEYNHPIDDTVTHWMPLPKPPKKD